MADDAVSGFVGLVLVPDAATIAAAYRLAGRVVADGAESMLAGGSLPHVTLTQCALREAPRSRLISLVDRLEERVRALRIPLGPLVVFGGGFVFWCVEPGSPARGLLQAIHQDALTLGEGLLDPAANAAIVEATARLTANDPVLVEHARRYGYAFVGEKYLPHITLGYDSRLAAGGTLAEPVHAHEMRVERVALARLGRYGVVQSLLSLLNA
jgi:2'-5' RNA ligase